MAMRVLVGNRAGTLLGEIEAEVGPISWRMNQVGRVQIRMSRRDAKASETLLAFGNRVVIQFSNGLPDWGGVIDPPREWDGGTVLFTAYSGEYLLGWRTTDKGRYFSQVTAGYIFNKLISEAQDVESLGIVLGEVWYGGAVHSPEYHYESILKKVQESVCGTLSTAEFDVVPIVSSGVVTFQANLYERMGVDKPNVALLEDINVAAAKMTEAVPITNYWSLAGAGQTWGDDRLISTAQDGTSVGLYGLRMDAAVYGDINEQATLDGHATDLVGETAYPVKMLDLEALDLAPAKFANYRVGDRIWLELPNYGFGGTAELVRVMGREYNPATGHCKLVVES